MDEIIRTNRHLAGLCLASDPELIAIAGEIDVAPPKDEISSYRLFSIIVKNPDTVFVNLLGTCSAGQSWATSQIMTLDLAHGYALTRTGSLYKVLGAPKHDEPGRDDLICLSAILNKWGLGQRLGVPAFFY